MEKMGNFENEFIKEKYWDKKEFRDAADVSARRTEKRASEKVFYKPTERIENYLNRFSEITEREDPEKHERGIRAIERLAEKKYIIKPENISDDYIKNVLLGNEAELLGYEREDINNEQIKQTILDSLETKTHSPLDDYEIPDELREQLENMIIADQKSRMKQWLNYLTGEESRHAPVALRYWAFAEMLKQGDYDPVRGEYNKRNDKTVAIFPELDQQALALVFDEINNKRLKKPMHLRIEDEEKRDEFKKLIQGENFGKLYSFMQEHVRSLKLPAEQLVVTEGEWKLYPQGSSAEDLTAPLQGFQTKWCIAGEGHAKSYLKNGDIWIYFSKDAEEKNTIPRACIVYKEQHGITEVRGIIFNEDVKQHLDDYITPVVDKKLKEMEGGEKWAEKMGDMKKLRELHFKHLSNHPFSKEDLIFLYEIDRPIQSSGYGRDPRIEEIRKARNTKEDAPIVLECEPEEIAWREEDINENTKAYVGKLFKGIFHKNFEHIYTEFPEGKIRKMEAEIGGKSKEDLIAELKENFKVSSTAEEILKSAEFTVSKDKEQIDLVKLTVKDLGFSNRATTDEIYEKAKELGLELCPSETGPHLRLQYKDQPMDEYLRVGMKQIIDASGNPNIFLVNRNSHGAWLYDSWADPTFRWNPSSKFVFRFRKLET